MRLAGGAEEPEPARPVIDIDGLNERELRDPDSRIVERLRMMGQLRAHRNMLQFHIGQRVRFRADWREVQGILSRYNRKTVTVITDGGERWNVAPALLLPGALTPVRAAAAGGVAASNTLPRPPAPAACGGAGRPGCRGRAAELPRPGKSAITPAD